MLLLVNPRAAVALENNSLKEAVLLVAAEVAVKSKT